MRGGSTGGGCSAAQPILSCCTPTTYIWEPVPQMWAESKLMKRPSGLKRDCRPLRAEFGPSQSLDEK